MSGRGMGGWPEWWSHISSVKRGSAGMGSPCTRGFVRWTRAGVGSASECLWPAPLYGESRGRGGVCVCVPGSQVYMFLLQPCYIKTFFHLPTTYCTHAWQDMAQCAISHDLNPFTQSTNIHLPRNKLLINGDGLSEALLTLLSIVEQKVEHSVLVPVAGKVICSRQQL